MIESTRTTYRPLPVPLYQRIFGVLHQRIENGTYGAGEQLRTEVELAEEFQVSKGTIRQALAVLAERGLILRKQGSGTFVAEIDKRPRFVGTFADLVVGAKRLRQRDFRLDTNVPFPAAVRAEYEMDATHGTAIVRRREINGEIFAYSIQYIAPWVATFITKRELTDVGFIPLLLNHGIAVEGGEQSVIAELADVDVAANLEIVLGAPVLAARRTLRSDRGAVEVVYAWYRGDLYEWQSTVTLSRSKDHLVVSTRDRVDDTH
jgi:GntR family transcriptional regulator